MAKSKQLKPADLIVVYWIDITSNDGWNDPTTVAEFQPLDMVTVGWLVNQDKEVVRLTNTICRVDGTSNVIVIPKAVIKDIKSADYERLD